MRSGHVGGLLPASVLALLLTAAPSGAGDGVAVPPDPSGVETLPVVPVRITNETDRKLSLSVTSAACTPRIFLEPQASVTISDCLRWGLVHQVVAVFYDQEVVHERQFRLLLVAPGRDRVFSSRRRSAPAALGQVRP
jgi:hypothetical protein